MADSSDITPLSLTADVALDRALGGGWPAWKQVALGKGVDTVSRWLRARHQDVIDAETATTFAESLIGDVPDDERAMSAAELAESIDEDDPELGIVLWEAVLEAGHDLGDADLLYEGTSNLAEIEEAFGDTLTAAEYYVAFINWRREDGNISDPELVLSAFDELVRLAEADGEMSAAARFGHDQAQFLRQLDNDEPAAESGDWDPARPAFTVWDVRE